jgi:L-iditol 2-dehydrogenase
MKEALMYGIGDLRVVESPIPEFNNDEMLVRIHACGICPTDIRKYRVGNHGVAKLPMNLGHEWAGDVVQVGSQVKQFKPGMRIASNGYAGYAEYAVVAPRFVAFSQELPDGVTYEEGTFVEPLADCVYCIESTIKVNMGDKIAIIGQGTMGQMKLKVAKHRGLKVMVSDTLDHRLEHSKKFGADMAVKPDEFLEAARDWTNGEGLDAVVLSVGAPPAINQAMEAVKERGWITLFGGFKQGSTATIDPNLIHYKEIFITGSYWVGIPGKYGDRKYYVKSLQLIADKIVPVEELITHRYTLDDIAEGFRVMESLEGFKVMIDIV